MIKPPKLRDQAAEQTQRYIVMNKLVIANRLSTETQLAEKFSLSHFGMRGVTKSLEFLGIVESEIGFGQIVGSIDIERLTEHLGFQSSLAEVDLQHFIDSRVIVETGVLSHVARNMTKDHAIGTELSVLEERFLDTRNDSQKERLP